MTLTLQEYSQLVESAITPVVLITACAFLLNFTTGRMLVLSERVRTYNSERIALIHPRGKADSDEGLWSEKRITFIEIQIPELFQRIALMRRAVLLIFFAISCFVLMMVLTGAALLGNIWLLTWGLVLLYVGLCMLLAAVGFLGLEARQGSHTLENEVNESHRLFPN